MEKLKIYSHRRLVSGRMVWKFEKEVSDWSAQFWIQLYRENEPKVAFSLGFDHPDEVVF